MRRMETPTGVLIELMDGEEGVGFYLIGRKLTPDLPVRFHLNVQVELRKLETPHTSVSSLRTVNSDSIVLSEMRVDTDIEWDRQSLVPISYLVTSEGKIVRFELANTTYDPFVFTEPALSS